MRTTFRVALCLVLLASAVTMAAFTVADLTREKPAPEESLRLGAWQGSVAVFDGSDPETPRSVTNIAVNAFYYCTALTDVYCTAVNPPSAKDAFTNSPISSATLHVPAQSLEAYMAASPWSEFGAKVAL